MSVRSKRCLQNLEALNIIDGRAKNTFTNLSASKKSEIKRSFKKVFNILVKFCKQKILILLKNSYKKKTFFFVKIQ